MEIVETKLKKLIASEGKLLVPKEIQYDEEGKEIPRVGAKVIYLAINDNENNYEEIEDAQ